MNFSFCAGKNSAKLKSSGTRNEKNPTQTRNRVGFGFENQFFSGQVRV